MWFLCLCKFLKCSNINCIWLKNSLEFYRLFKSWRYINCTFDANGKLVQENLECPGDLVYTEEYGKCVDYNMAFECKLFKVFFLNNHALHVIRGGEWGNPKVAILRKLDGRGAKLDGFGVQHFSNYSPPPPVYFVIRPCMW